MAEIEEAMDEQQSPELQQHERNELHKISEQYSHIPPSPGANTLFAHGNLGDIMAAEFGELTVRHQQASSPSPSEDYSTDTALQSRSVSSTDAYPREQKLEEHEQATTTIQEIQPVDDALVSLDVPAADLAGSSSSTTSAVNEVEQQLGPSILGGDMLYNAVAFGDGEGHSRQRILAFAAKRCANAVQKNPQDYDSLYNWALVLQESADNIGADVPGAGKDQLLEEACSKYDAATSLCPTLHEAFYNWAIAISDRAKARGRTKEAEELWKQACKRYERAVQLNRNSPQALNNWGLALQELSGIVPIKDKRSIVKTAIKKFRAAISLQFDFHRAIYNLGTVLYGLAEDTIRTGNQPAGLKELTASELYSQSAIYVAAAHALKPDYPVYRSALRLVRSKLPLAYLKTGYLSVAPDGRALVPHSDWKRMWFVLDHEAFYQVDKAAIGLSPTKASEASLNNNGLQMNGSNDFRIDIADICGLSQCADLSLPPGPAFCVDSTSGQHYLIAETWEEVYCWVDAIRLVYTIYLRGQSDVLGGIIAG